MKMRDLLNKIKELEENPVPQDALDLANPEDLADEPTDFSHSSEVDANAVRKSSYGWTGKSGTKYVANTEYDQNEKPISWQYSKQRPGQNI